MDYEKTSTPQKSEKQPVQAIHAPLFLCKLKERFLIQAMEYDGLPFFDYSWLDWCVKWIFIPERWIRIWIILFNNVTNIQGNV